MKKLFRAGLVIAALPLLLLGQTTAQQRELLDKYCVTCHNARLKTGTLSLEKLDLTHVGDNAEVCTSACR